MKKIIAFVLALVMCAAIFVGCDTSIPKLDDGGGISIPIDLLKSLTTVVD